jgi:hypothetical protein
VREVLAGFDLGQVDIRGALCFPDPEGLPMFRRLSVRRVVVDGTKPVARLARRPGPVAPELVERIWRDLALSFPPA